MGKENMKSDMTEKPENGGITIYVCGGFEQCKDGEHDWSGPMIYFAPGGGTTEEKEEACGGAATCSKCGVDAMSHSMWYGP